MPPLPSRPARLARPSRPSRVDLTEVGTTGRGAEEPLRALSGDGWRRALAEMVANDPIVGAVLLAVELYLRQVTWDVVPGSPDAADVAAATFVEECRQDMAASWEDTLAEIVSFLPHGWSFLETVYKVRGGEATDDPTHRSRFTDGRIGWRKWAIRAQDTLDHWVFDAGGGVQALVQTAPPTYHPVTIPITKALLFRTTSRKGDPEGRSLLRNAYTSWYYKNHLQRIEGVGIERDLAGLPVLTVPPELLDSANRTAAQTSLFTELLQLITNIRRDEQEGIMLPAAFDEAGHPLFALTLLTTGGRRQFDTDAVIRRYDQRIAASMLADFVLLGSDKVGSYALASNKTDLFATALGTWLDHICGVVNQHAIPRLLRLNGLRPLHPPRLEHGDVQSVDLVQLADFVLKLAQAGFVFQAELQRYVLERAGLPVPGPDAPTTPTSTATAGPTGPGVGSGGSGSGSGGGAQGGRAG